MADALKAIRELILQKTQIDDGKIISINEDGSFLVSTKNGVISVDGDSTLFKVGDSVKIEDSTITVKSSTEDSLVVHER